MKNNRLILRRINGFTLIEIIITISIISLLFSAMIAYYNQANEQKKLTTAIQKLDDVLHLVQKKATVGEIIEQDCTNFTGYQIEFTEHGYAAYFCCNDICNDSNHSDHLISTYTLDSSLTFALVPAVSSIHFLPLTGRIDGNDDITIKISNLSKCSQIIVENSGLMSLINPCP